MMVPTGLARAAKEQVGSSTEWRRWIGPADDAAQPLHAALVVVFTMGLCPILACAFMSVDPDRFMLVETDPDGGNWHVAVQERDGTVWDIQGSHTAAAFEDVWGDFGFLRSDDRIDMMVKAGAWQTLADYLTDPDDEFGLDDGVTDNIWRVTCGLAAELLNR